MTAIDIARRLSEVDTVIGSPMDEIPTPALVLDIAAVERNIDRMARRFRGSEVRLRPHAKTHKVPQIARLQVAAGAAGITCATILEAETLVDAGGGDVLISNVYASDAKLRRIVVLARRAAVIVALDDLVIATRLGFLASELGLTVDVVVDVDVGQHRTGVDAGPGAAKLATQVAKVPGLRFRGLQGYEGHAQHVLDEVERKRVWSESSGRLLDVRRMLEATGLAVDIVTGGGTGTHRFVRDADGLTECQAGSYVFMDAHYGRVEGIDFEAALSVVGEVVSIGGDGRVVVDAGLKALSPDSGPPAVMDQPEATFRFAGDEHGVIEGLDRRTRRGDRIVLTPGHCDPTVNLFDVYFVMRDGLVVECWPIVARGH
jgi:D-serine deaminase-like pyridoxal phosphate-dependent protein